MASSDSDREHNSGFIRKPKCFWLERANSASRRGIPSYMKIKLQMSALFLGAALLCGSVVGWSEQPAPAQDNGPKQDMKDAGHETKDATKDAAHGTKQGTKKAYHSTKRGTKKAWHKTKDTTKGAVNGAKEGAKQPK
jgi:hypothetical protein